MSLNTPITLQKMQRTYELVEQDAAGQYVGESLGQMTLFEKQQ